MFFGNLHYEGNILAAAAGTIVGNPWTFPIIYYVCYKIGLIFGFDGIDSFELSFNFFLDNFETIFFPTLIGSIPISILVWFITYRISKYLLTRNYENVK